MAGKAKVFLIDDEILLAESIALNLKDEYDVSLFSSPKEALEQMRLGRVPEVCVTDIRMPEMSGMEFIEAVRGDMMSVPIIIMSAYADKNYAIRAMDYKVSALLEKPVDPELLAKKITAANIYDRYMKIYSKLADILEQLTRSNARLAGLYRTRFVRAETLLLDHGLEIIQQKSNDMESFLKNAEEEFELEELIYDLQMKLTSTRLDFEKIKNWLSKNEEHLPRA